MIIFPPAKVNLGLNVLYKREDGYHELDTCMIPIPFTDVLEILPSNDFVFKQTGLMIDVNPEKNLCVKAFRLMQEKYSCPEAYIHLRKIIPMGAGLGGGSADAAYVLKGLRDLFSLPCSDLKLEELAAELGSDCPFFIANKAQIAKGRGENLSPCDLDLAGYYIKLINPGVHVATTEAYAGIEFSMHTMAVREIIEGPLNSWKGVLKNDFETTVFRRYPALKFLKDQLYAEGAIYAAMSGSGSTIFGIYQDEPAASFEQFPDYLEIIRKF
ncbi:MAG: 4-(cytidine 5'-diphospho)-2-C-methyl-D-erythritol kinase [Flavobacteriales bacterium]